MMTADRSVKAEQTFDLRGLKCPLPALFARRALLRNVYGNVIEIVCDDPMAHIDVPHMCRQEGFEVLEQRCDGNAVRLMLRRPQPILP